MAYFSAVASEINLKDSAVPTDENFRLSFCFASISLLNIALNLYEVTNKVSNKLFAPPASSTLSTTNLKIAASFASPTLPFKIESVVYA